MVNIQNKAAKRQWPLALQPKGCQFEFPPPQAVLSFFPWTRHLTHIFCEWMWLWDWCLVGERTNGSHASVRHLGEGAFIMPRSEQSGKPGPRRLTEINHLLQLTSLRQPYVNAQLIALEVGGHQWQKATLLDYVMACKYTWKRWRK